MARVSKSTPRIAHNPVLGAFWGRPPVALGSVMFCSGSVTAVSAEFILNSGSVTAPSAEGIPYLGSVSPFCLLNGLC